MAFGLLNASHTFQHFMERLFKHLPLAFCYMDDPIIDSRTLEEHHEHLQQISTILQENRLQINPAKCVFAATATAVEFLGHWVDQHGVRQLQRHAQAISDLPPTHPSGCETVTTVFGNGELLRTFPSRYRPARFNPSPRHSKGTPRCWSGCPLPPSRWPRAHWRLRYRWRTPPQTPCSPWPQTPLTPMWGACCSSWPEGAGNGWPSTQRSCQGRAPDTPPLPGSCWPLSAQCHTSDFFWKGDVFSFSLTTNH
jgi:hypothetical protein